MHKLLVAIAFVALLSQISSKKWKVEQTSDKHFNDILERFNDQIVVDTKLHQVDGLSKPEGKVFHLAGGCNECLIAVDYCTCTKRQCFREAPSEEFVCQVVGATSRNMCKLAKHDGKSLVLWKYNYSKTDDKQKPYRLEISWIRFVQYSG